PNSKLTSKDFDSRKITIAPKHETLHQFVAKTDLVFVGNSAVQLRLLCMGVPVVHVSGFDKFGYDLYGYCEIGLCIGFNRVNHIDLDLVKSFYENISLLTKLNAYVNVH